MLRIRYTALIFGFVIAFADARQHQRSSNQKRAALKRILVKDGFPSQNFVSPHDPLYVTLNDPWQLKPPSTRPSAFILPRNEDDVQTIVVMATKLNIRIVAKGGGHSFEKFSYGDLDSIVIDLRLLTQIQVDPVTKRATVGAGVLLGPLGLRLWEIANVLIPLSYCPTVGIAGNTLGGGQGPLTAAYGLTLDNVDEMNMVSAQGQVLVVNYRRKSDLFFALRGAGPSFGIVTKFVFRTYPAPQFVFDGVLLFNISMFAEVVFAYQNYLLTQLGPDNVTSQLGVFSRSQVRIRFTDLTGTDKKFEEIRKLFPPTTSTLKQSLTFPEYLLYAAQSYGENYRNLVKLQIPADLALLNRTSAQPVYQYRKSYFVQKVVDISRFAQLRDYLTGKPDTVVVYFDPFAGAVYKVGASETAFVHRRPNLYNAVANYKVIDGSDLVQNEIARNYVQGFFDLGRRIFQHVESYQNFVDIELENYLERQYGSNLPRLIYIKRKYDPENIFNDPQSIPTSF